MRSSFRQIRKGPTKPHISNIISKPQSQCAPVLSKHSYHVAPSMHNIKQFDSPNESPSSENLVKDMNQNYNFNADQLCDLFVSKAATMPLCAAVESFLKEKFKASTVIYWQEIPNAQILYSPTMKLKNDHSNGIIGTCYFQRTVMRVPQNSAHPSFSSQVDGKIASNSSSLLLFPLYDWRNALCAIAEVVSDLGEFSQDDEVFANWFSSKFKLFSKWLKQPFVNDNSLHELMEIHDHEAFTNIICRKMRETFDCREFEIWTYQKKQDKMMKFQEPIESTEGGIVGDSLTREQTINAISNRLNSSYNSKIDGDLEESVLSIPVTEKEDELVHSVALRGSNHDLFNKDDEDTLKKLAPFILLAYANAQEFSGLHNDVKSSREEQDSLAILLDVIETMLSQLDSNKLYEMILEKGRSLTSSDRCSLFLLDESKESLASFYQTGLNKPIVIPVSNGIAGRTLKEKKVYNIPDAYECEYFNSNTDRETGYRTKSILSVPIYSTRGEVIGVTQMINKKGNTPFSEWDGKIIQIFNIFCGIAIDNAKLYKESVDSSNLLKPFLNTAFALTKSEDIKNMLNDILKNARVTVQAERCSLFLYDESSQQLSSFLADGGKVPPTIPMNIGIAAAACKEKEGIVENDVYKSPDFNRQIDVETGYKTRNIIASPIIGPDGEILGIVEMLNKKSGDFQHSDLETTNAFASFASVALQKNRLKDIAQYGDIEVESSKYISDSEKSLYTIPEKLTLTEEEKKTVTSLNCFAVDFKGVGHIKELFYFFNYFNLLEKYKVTNDRFFRFISTISRTYTTTSYHNWTHACDVTQYLTYQLITSHADKIFNSDELFIMLTSGVCHDANHSGLNNVYNVKAETPLGILFKDTSVMEMHHLTISIPIISQSDINLFGSFDDNEIKKMWTLFINLILSTDMAKHFELVKKGQALIENKEFDWSNQEHRLLGMQILIKIADISNVSRPFEYADKWCDILNEEFFHQGDLEKSSGIGLTSPLNDREHPDKPKSQIGFYNFICLPLYTVASQIYPELIVNADSVRSNLEKWKELAAANAAKAEENKQ
ncbi:3'5'-cyclic nucleotide phosphodiesterase family protein [Tritrichomonas foetus]|uniref:3'5'-cyclic nucleotide phosphodiesterase family protein n=1 Tax=Tritrichomonas foetus TaxID=1144522 RepID=A0A1J4JQ00_9EUKA|nr:3'5'-cyclic nucleotide phosphodiesterase family protein [Tritrichomonas foetus]|eukprot:OHT01185.1 3'5'-cyclic nucleotide phosphodiesterase family protein [Tritrichomonas foetus]